MDIGILNSLGYIEVIEISIWLGVMYFGNNDGILIYNGSSWNKIKLPNSSSVYQ